MLSHLLSNLASLKIQRGGTRLLRLLPRLVVVKNKKERIFLKKWSKNAILKAC